MLSGAELCASKLMVHGLATSLKLTRCCTQHHNRQLAFAVSHCWHWTGMSDTQEPLYSLNLDLFAENPDTILMHLNSAR